MSGFGQARSSRSQGGSPLPLAAGQVVGPVAETESGIGHTRPVAGIAPNPPGMVR